MSTEPLVHGITLNRKTPNVDFGTKAFWEKPFHEMYALLPFPTLWAGLIVILEHMDDPSLDERIRQKIINLKDFDTVREGLQIAAGLYYPGRSTIELAAFVDNWRADYTGPIRPLQEHNRVNTRKTLVHEVGHYYDDKVGFKNNTRDDVSRLLYNRFMELSLPQTSSVAENFAEHFRAANGCNDTRGKFSDNNVANLNPGLISLLRCMFWLSLSLRNRWVVSLVPTDFGVMFQTWIGLGWKWRYINHVNWRQQEYNGRTWVDL